MHVRHHNVCRVAGGRHVRDDVAEAVAADVVIAGPRVGADLAAASDVVEDEVGQRVCLTRRDPSHPHPLGPLSSTSTAIATIALPRAAAAEHSVCRAPT